MCPLMRKQGSKSEVRVRNLKMDIIGFSAAVEYLATLREKEKQEGLGANIAKGGGFGL